MLTDPHCPFLGGDFRHRSNVGWSSSRLTIPGSTTTPNGGARSSWSSTDRSSLSAWMEAVIASGAVTSYGWKGCRCAPCTTVDTRPPCWSPFRGELPRLSAEFPLQEEWDTIGAMVARQRMFDIAHAWGSNPPGGGPCFVVTHTAPQEWVKEGSPFTFVAD